LKQGFIWLAVHGAISEVKGMNVDESVANLDICRRFCGSCPTYKENALKNGTPSLLFCARANSDKGRGVKMVGCNCPGCGVHKRYKLTGDYFCST
jgi:RNase P subunit RPR2